MPASSVNRKLLRAEMGAVLAARLQTTNDFADGFLCRKVYPYLVGDLKAGVPILCVSAAPGGGSDRKVTKFQATDWQGNDIYLNLSSFVLYATEDGTWTEQMAQDRLDDIEAKVADILMDNREHAPYWASVEYAQRSRPVVQRVDGVAYFIELIGLRLKVML